MHSNCAVDSFTQEIYQIGAAGNKDGVKKCSGIISITVSRSSKMASIRVFLNIHVDASPAAASIENRTPAEVGAANLAASSDSIQV